MSDVSDKRRADEGASVDTGSPEAFGLFSRPSPNDYKYNYDYLPGLALVDKLPSHEKPRLGWYKDVVLLSLRIAYNRVSRATKAGAEVARGDAPHEDEPLAFLEPSADHDEAALSLDHLGLPPLDLSVMPELDEPDEEEDAARAGEPVVFRDDGGGKAHALAQAAKIAGAVQQAGIRDPLAVLGTVLKSLVKNPSGRPTSLDDYKALFGSVPLPWTAERYDDDEVFAYLRVAGANPLVIRRVEALDKSFPVNEAHYKAAMGDAGDSLARAGAEGRLFLADYVALARVQNGNFPAGPKYAFAPKALFALRRGSGARGLSPVAIQCGQDPRCYPVFTPADGEAWRRAKVVVSCADNIHHEMISHLGRTHLLMGPFAIALRRRMDDDHPLSELLRPHFEGLLSINDSAQSGLVAPGAQVDKSLGGTIKASVTLAAESLSVPYFNTAFLPDALEARGVMSPDLEYPYRDDALLIWKAIERWVTAYVDAYYPSDADVAGDEQLRAWAAEVVAKNGGRILGFGEDGAGRITTLTYLKKALTLIVFTSSAQHAAVNSPQSELMTFTPSSPFATFRAAPLSREDAALSPYLDMFAPMELAQLQMEFCSLLGGVRYTRLGDYGTLWKLHPKLRKPLDAFQKELEEIGATIDERNKTRLGPYPFLHPRQIPASINI